MQQQSRQAPVTESTTEARQARKSSMAMATAIVEVVAEAPTAVKSMAWKVGGQSHQRAVLGVSRWQHRSSSSIRHGLPDPGMEWKGEDAYGERRKDMRCLEHVVAPAGFRNLHRPSTPIDLDSAG